MTPSVTDETVSIGLRLFLLAVLPEGVEVVSGQDNRVPEPSSLDHITITPASRRQLSTTTHEEDVAGGAILIGRSTAAHLQLDVYGPNATDNSQVITTLLRDAYGAAMLAGYGIAPLYCNDGQQMPLVNGEEQYEQRWTIETVLQINPTVSTPGQFADNVAVTIHGAD